jgi:RNA polymerase sigma factor (sigma-70 family)
MIEQQDAALRSSAAGIDANGQTPWPALIQRIQADDAKGMEDLYHVFSRGIRFFLWRQLGKQDMEDTVHDTFLAVAEAIRRGEVRDPDRLMGFVWTVVRRHLAAHIERTVNLRNQCAEMDVEVRVQDPEADPEWKAIVRQQQSLAQALLQEVSGRDREVLIRFYLKEQTQEQICRDMQLTATQFRLLKSRAKARLETLGRKKLARRRIFWQ